MPVLNSLPDNSLSDKERGINTLETRMRVSWRAFAVGLPLLLLVCFISVYADMVSGVIQLGVLQLAPPAIVALLLLSLFNRAVLQLFKRELLSRADLVVVYSMLLIGALISTRGLIEKLIPPLAYLPYYATRENRLNELITQHIPAWVVPFTPSALVQPPSSVISAFHEGSNGAGVPWNMWIGPLVCWAALVGCVCLVFACLATILRRQWIDNEQLRFPLTTLPLALINDEVEGQPFFSNRAMWAGVAVAVFVFGLNGLNANFAEFPIINLNLDLGFMFTERPWNQMLGLTLFLSLAAVGFAFFLPLDLLFSLWFFVLLTRFQDILIVNLGGIPEQSPTHFTRIWTGNQAIGAYVMLALAQFRIGWPYFKDVWRTAFGPKNVRPLDDSEEMFSYRTAILGLVFGFGGIVLWLALAGMSPLLAAVQMGLYLFFVAMIMTRAVSEAGLLMTETSFLPSQIIQLFVSMPTLGPANLSILALTNAVFARDLRGVLLAPFLGNQKLAKEVGLSPRALRFPLFISVLLSFVAASAIFLVLNYQKGALALYSYPTDNARLMMNASAGQIAGNGYTPDAMAYGGVAIGVIVTLFLTWMRASFTWFPFHPLAYAIAPNWAMHVFWFPFFVAWAVKSLVLRFGTVETYRKMTPFMLGLILGEFGMAMFWALGNIFRGWGVPNFPWP